MAKFIPYATTDIKNKPYSEGYMWVDTELGLIRFDLDGKQIYAHAELPDIPEPAAVNYNDLENLPIKYFDDVETLTAEITDSPLYFMWKGEASELSGINYTLEFGYLYFAILVQDETQETPVIFIKKITGETESESEDPSEDPIVVDQVITRVDELTGDAVSDNGYYIADNLTDIVYSENNSEPTATSVDKLYVNTALTEAEIFDKLNALALPTLEGAQTVNIGGLDFTIVPFMQQSVDGERGPRGLWLSKMSGMTPAPICFIYAGDQVFLTNYTFTSSIIYIGSSLTVEEIDKQVSDGWVKQVFGVDHFGWNNPTTGKAPLFSSVTVKDRDQFTADTFYNKDIWNDLISTTGNFALKTTLEKEVVYNKDGDTFSIVDGKGMQVCDSLPAACPANLDAIVYNTSDNNIYRSIKTPNINTDKPITIERIIPGDVQISSAPTSGVYFNTALSEAELLKLIKLSGTYAGKFFYSANDSEFGILYSLDADHLQIYDNTGVKLDAAASPVIIYDNLNGGWDTSRLTEDSHYTFAYDFGGAEWYDDNCSWCLNPTEPVFAKVLPIDRIFFDIYEEQIQAGAQYIPLIDIDERYAWTMYFAPGGFMSMPLDYQIITMMSIGSLPDSIRNKIDDGTISEDELNDSLINILYAANAGELAPGIAVEQPGWQLKYFDESTGQLKLPKFNHETNKFELQPFTNGLIASCQNDATYPAAMDIGKVISETPFSINGYQYKWENISAKFAPVTPEEPEEPENPEGSGNAHDHLCANQNRWIPFEPEWYSSHGNNVYLSHSSIDVPVSGSHVYTCMLELNYAPQFPQLPNNTRESRFYIQFNPIVVPEPAGWENYTTCTSISTGTHTYTLVLYSDDNYTPRLTVLKDGEILTADSGYFYYIAEEIVYAYQDQ